MDEKEKLGYKLLLSIIKNIKKCSAYLTEFHYPQFKNQVCKQFDLIGIFTKSFISLGFDINYKFKEKTSLIEEISKININIGILKSLTDDNLLKRNNKIFLKYLCVNIDSKKKFQTVKNLILNFFDPKMIVKYRDNYDLTILDMLFQSEYLISENDILEVIIFLKKNNFDFDYVGDYSETYLYHAIYKSFNYVIKKLKELNVCEDIIIFGTNNDIEESPVFKCFNNIFDEDNNIDNEDEENEDNTDNEDENNTDIEDEDNTDIEDDENEDEEDEENETSEDEDSEDNENFNNFLELKLEESKKQMLNICLTINYCINIGIFNKNMIDHQNNTLRYYVELHREYGERMLGDNYNFLTMNF